MTEATAACTADTYCLFDNVSSVIDEVGCMLLELYGFVDAIYKCSNVAILDRSGASVVFNLS